MYHVSSQKREQNYKGLRRKFKVQNVDIELCSFIWFFLLIIFITLDNERWNEDRITILFF